MRTNEIRIRVSLGSPLGETMNKMRTWLDRQKIQPREFKTGVDGKGYAFTIAFSNEDEAELFRQQFQVPELTTPVPSGPKPSAT